MDKDLLRIVIIAMGVTVVVAMLLWSVFKSKRTRRGIDFYDKGNPLDNIDESLVLSTENDDFDIIPLGSAVDDEYGLDPVTVASEVNQDEKLNPEIIPQQTEPVHLPSIIQFSIVALDDEGFNGAVLAELFQQVGLEYGSMKVFERLDDQRRVDFAVASMVEPGTFPETDLENFSSPGIVFFIQPGELDKPLENFDEFIQTIDLLATELNGLKWDHNREPLTDDTVQQFRHHLATI